ncbi:hypothetical protein R1sor_019018 [Riccia sorocarpa]|uniref:Uncharacterized protein n=1 Tax=Riccia sorocarpa TaxID=122646 RepID=A0ABD3ICH1_9MARC
MVGKERRVPAELPETVSSLLRRTGRGELRRFLHKGKNIIEELTSGERWANLTTRLTHSVSERVEEEDRFGGTHGTSRKKFLSAKQLYDFVNYSRSPWWSVEDGVRI